MSGRGGRAQAMPTQEERRAAARAEEARRQREREARAPITREELDALHEWLTDRVLGDGYDATLRHTRAWLAANGKPVDAIVAFLRRHDLASDFDVLMGADPNQLFGPANGRLARMPLEPEELTRLIVSLEATLADEMCENDLRLTRRWLEQHGLPATPTELALRAQGGFCDCEVVMNVQPDRIYTKELLARRGGERS